MSQMLHEAAGVIPKEVVVMNDQEVVVEFEEDTPMIEVSNAIHGLFHWVGQSLSVNSLLARRDLMTDIVKQCKVGWERQRDLEKECHEMQEDQQEHQQQVIEVLGKVSDQVKKVENMSSKSIPVLEGYNPIPPVSQTRIATPG